MKNIDNHRRAWLLFSLCFALVCSLVSGVVEAKDKGGGKCEGTKKQRKQKMEPRDITDAQLQDMIAEYKKTLNAERELMNESVVRRVIREYEAHQATGEPYVYDFLIISGGGQKGAFGAGFLQGWGEITSGQYVRPEFDMITGVSTGALIAPFASLGTDEAYASVVDFYANPDPNWVKKRGMIKFLPSHISMYNNCHLQDTIRSVVDLSMVEAMAKVAEEDRLLLIGTTNLDVGAGRVFDLGQACRQALEEGSSDRVTSILVASASIPGVFPPIEIDGMLYADGGATSNLFLASFPGPDGAIARFKARKPDAPLPKVRLWVIVNQQLKPKHAVTEPKWISISGRALGTMTSTGQIFALAILRDMVSEARGIRGADAELHLVSIPADAPESKTSEMFDQEYMRALEDLGRKMGADPSSWTDQIPSAYQVEGEWIQSE